MGADPSTLCLGSLGPHPPCLSRSLKVALDQHPGEKDLDRGEG